MAALTTAQLDALKADILAQTDPTIIAARTPNTANPRVIVDFYNTAAAGPVLAWRISVPKSDIFEALNLDTYDGLTAGKRDAFKMLFDNAPVDATINARRKAIVDVFAIIGGYADAAQLPKMAAAWAESATRAEVVFGTTVPNGQNPIGGVSAVKRTRPGLVTLDDISNALNR